MLRVVAAHHRSADVDQDRIHVIFATNGLRSDDSDRHPAVISVRDLEAATAVDEFVLRVVVEDK
ncbi:hypothetical protein LK10_15270 [Sinomonas humi]|uniref:Uncharacterized protein n=2 Tax=Sinomonas humi TaxID=1338436 RepID=A0A0B2AEC6_9MICC|nr:hypothetical protein LK10_15270 [Sinomonas humi]